MDKIEAVRLALAEVGDVTAEELVAFVKVRYGVTVEPKIVPIIKATLRDKERMEVARQRRAAVAVKSPVPSTALDSAVETTGTSR